ncbi:MAG: ABC transporter permease, partial [Muribaculaceae bacterium]|nr:ABC transporter permease [Muribaculaceae bacterium]
MSKLLRANFHRLFRSRLFWFCTAAVFAMAVVSVFNQAQYTKIIDGMLFSGISIAAAASAVFISIFIGTEYSDGTMRGKIYPGHSRTAVYAANLVVCAAAALIMHAVLIAAVVCFGVPVIGKITAPLSDIFIMSLLSVLIVTAFSSAYILLGMLITNKAAGAVAAVLLAFALLLGANALQRDINASEYYPAPYIDETSET